MSDTRGLAHSVPPFQTGIKNCTRCGKDFHLFRTKKNCYNCGSAVCESCSIFRTKLPQFGYTQHVRCCAYCAHFLQVSKMDYARLSELNIKTLRGYLLSYNLPTQGMLEKQDLVKAIQSYKPIPEASELYFRRHLPATPEKSNSLFEGLTGVTGASQGSSSSSSGDGWSWDIDKFFSKLFGADDRDSTSRPNRSQSQSHSRPPQSESQPQASRPPNSGPGFTFSDSSSAPQSFSYRPHTESPPPNTYYTQARPSTVNQHSSSPRPQTQTAPTPRATSAASSLPSRPRPQDSPLSQNTQQTILTLEQVMTSKTDPSTLPIKTIKGILDHGCVTYVGVVEKQDLVARLQKLIDNTRAEQEMLQEQESAAKSKSPTESTKGSSGGGGGEDDNLCKICCDAALNCVMLNCNHMSTCMDCGKLIMEGSRMCPICREYVVKLLHVFRA